MHLYIVTTKELNMRQHQRMTLVENLEKLVHGLNTCHKLVYLIIAF